MNNDIFSLLMLILLLENGGGSENINQLVIMFLLMQNKNQSDCSPCARNSGGTQCGRESGYTF